MKKFVLVFFSVVLSGVAACGWANKNKVKSNIDAENNKVGSDSSVRELSKNIKDASAVAPSKPLAKVESPAQEPEPKPRAMRHYDSKALDARVMEEAKAFGVDSKGYRMLVRTEPDGAKIYRELGMHIIVNPNGEEVFLPDEI